MKRTLTLCLAGLLLFPAQAERRVGEAQVRTDANGRPCFTISEREERLSGTPEFQAITVTEDERVLWRMVMPRGRSFPVSFSMCIPYGGRVPALPQTPAAPLDEGKVYTVRIDTGPGKNATTPFRYSARFCPTRGHDGGTAVHNIGAADRKGRDRYGCLGTPGWRGGPQPTGESGEAANALPAA